MLRMLGKNFSRQHFKIFFLFFSQKIGFDLLYNCLLWEQFARNVESYFLGQLLEVSGRTSG